ncbi:MAG: hypothetical protein HPY83_00430 [Anaerolineae bacterium]|nr:hypothetical protein [Anaerolineae bacterium]
MRFSVGYQLPLADDQPTIVDLVRLYRQSIAEVYFAWVGMASGRARVGHYDGDVDWGSQHQIEADLTRLSDMGVGLSLLLNANCYGGLAVSTALANEVSSLVRHLLSFAHIAVVTTTSPFVAHVIKQSWPEIDVRASVNMRIGTVEGMQYLSDLFDSFCVLRDDNRDLDRLGELKEWADQNGKRLTILANSGCLYACSGQTYHDNLVAHEAEVSRTVNGSDWNPVTCWRYYAESGHWVSWMKSTWIRPEDVASYEPYVSQVKLATRMHSSPGKVIDAYARGKFHGNLMDLMEPSHSLLLHPCIVANDRFPADWFERTSACHRQCRTCSYCEEVLARVLVREDALLPRSARRGNGPLAAAVETPAAGPEGG